MMLIPKQTSIKVHFAGCENIPQFLAVKTVGVAYTLFSAFTFLAEKANAGGFQIFENIEPMQAPNLINDNSRHCIMDSGLFSLMFGAYGGKKDKAFIYQWQEWLLEFIHESGYRGACVEVDCQKVLSPAHAWTLRQRFRQALPNNRVINVFHLEDGRKGLDRLIESSDYIAISVPEFRLNRIPGEVVHMAHYVKHKRPELDIHLLGCTDLGLLGKLPFCTSADSSSWTASVRFGRINTLVGSLHIEKFKAGRFINQYQDRVTAMAKRLKIEVNNLPRTAALAFGAEQCLHRYASTAGEQS